MRSLAESTKRWHHTLDRSSTLAHLQHAVRADGPQSPCVAGARSVCWKAFLLSQSTASSSWSQVLLGARSTYSSLRDHFLKYIEHPEYLAAGSSDPLADDADSPWNTLRQDELLRAEILQDVQRLPDEPFYHKPETQALVLDVLFIYCKLNPDVGGYRQGMHELLAPIVWVVDQDALDPVDAASDASADLEMIEMLDASFVEHDSFALFSKVMEHAKGFYQVSEPAPGQPPGPNPQPGGPSIVERSQHIHETCLYRVDPELADHLKSIEILPQIFLIRWIRLLFSREFPFGQMLVLWDTLFSIDPSFSLIDLICTAMLVRIRWDLLEADYSTVLQLLLKYPAPVEPHGPHTFVDDALFLRGSQNAAGGSALIEKYTGRPPAEYPGPGGPQTPRRRGSSPRRGPPAVPRSPLSPSRLLPQPQQPRVGVEALFQGAAKGMLERGEKLGINQAVRDAMGEIRRNVSEARSNLKANRDLLSEPGPGSGGSGGGGNSVGIRAVAAMDRRNKQLAAMLDETVGALRQLAGSDMEDRKQHQEAIEIAAAKVQFVQVYLQDSTMALPNDNDDDGGGGGGDDLASRSPRVAGLEKPSVAARDRGRGGSVAESPASPAAAAAPHL